MHRSLQNLERWAALVPDALNGVLLCGLFLIIQLELQEQCSKFKPLNSLLCARTAWVSVEASIGGREELWDGALHPFQYLRSRKQGRKASCPRHYFSWSSVSFSTHTSTLTPKSIKGPNKSKLQRLLDGILPLEYLPLLVPSRAADCGILRVNCHKV